MTAESELLDRAQHTRLVVIGGGIGGLVAALQCAKVGIAVTVLEAADRPGGAIRAAEVAGLTVDAGAESYATRGGHVRALIDELGLTDAVVTPSAGRAWVHGLPGAAPLPAGGVLGIPANPWNDDVRRIIGWSGVWRAYLDRVRPPLTIGHERSLGKLVRSRMGAKVLDRLVAPVVAGVYSARPDDVDVEIAAPGLSTALTRTGSLSGAVSTLQGHRDLSKAPGAAVEGLDGGMSTLIDALVSRLRELGVEVRTGVRVDALARCESAWRLATTTTDADAPVEEELAADIVIVATDETAARALLAPEVPALADEQPAQPRIDVVTLVLDAAALDTAPRGTGVLAVPGTTQAKALTHSTAKWQWLAAQARSQHPHRHVVRVSFGAQGEAPATDGLSDDDVAALALAEASVLLGVALEPAQLVASHIERYAQSQPASVIGRRERMAAVREAVHRVPRVGVTGAWLAGTGLAQVVPDAIDEAEHVRRTALWAEQAQA
ncbi:protoporphyrinogen oxidase [Microbacterium fluvii]|uniref:Coproporphyrinogen III oxidase n=1 Tax=Microbacterium fluvii TaxID=415215 RepID=A0ABW2HIC1_9MICO|nr:protoporphyrinogen oxidase [Microbacterium fluvii]MCU4672907.1 protoporphyrinogen oxidase [Microbacterium fluvii]